MADFWGGARRALAPPPPSQKKKERGGKKEEGREGGKREGAIFQVCEDLMSTKGGLEQGGRGTPTPYP